MLIGRRVRLAAVARSHAVRGKVASAGLREHVDPTQELLPTQFEGRLAGGPPGAMRDLAVAVNGHIRAVGRSFHLRGKRAEFFSLMIPESALRPGHNDVELLEVRRGGGLTALTGVR